MSPPGSRTYRPTDRFSGRLPTVVESSDAYLLLLGGSYAILSSIRALSPTEAEGNVARRRGPDPGVPQAGRAMESEQQRLVARVEEYTGGPFRSAFEGPVDLQPQVVDALTELSSGPTPLAWPPLEHHVTVPWIHDVEEARYGMRRSATLEAHLVAIEPRSHVQVRDLEALLSALGRLDRDHGLFASGDAVTEHVGGDVAYKPYSS
jgi:hypothetical protein